MAIQASRAEAAQATKTEISGFCFVVATDNAGGWACEPGATGIVIQNDNNWTLIAHVDHSYDLQRAVQLRSADIDGALCGESAGLNPTENWQSVTRPSGTATLVCHGVQP